MLQARCRAQPRRRTPPTRITSSSRATTMRSGRRCSWLKAKSGAVQIGISIRVWAQGGCPCVSSPLLTYVPGGSTSSSQCTPALSASQLIRVSQQLVGITLRVRAWSAAKGVLQEKALRMPSPCRLFRALSRVSRGRPRELQLRPDHVSADAQARFWQLQR